jgi:hypothetical protein
MSKSTAKNSKTYDSNILDALFLKYRVSKYYIRQCINGSVNTIKADAIKKDYITMKRAVEDTISGFIEINTTK